MKDGKRDHDTKQGGNLCLSNPGLFRQFVDDACRFFDEHPDSFVFSVMPNDHTRICQCAECQAQAECGALINMHISTITDSAGEAIAGRRGADQAPQSRGGNGVSARFGRPHEIGYSRWR